MLVTRGISVWLKTCHIFHVHHGENVLVAVGFMYAVCILSTWSDCRVVCGALLVSWWHVLGTLTHRIILSHPHTQTSLRFEANLSIKFDQTTAGVVSNSAQHTGETRGPCGPRPCGIVAPLPTEATVLFRKTQRLPSNCLGTDMKQMDDLQPGEQPMVSKKPNVTWWTKRWWGWAQW